MVSNIQRSRRQTLFVDNQDNRKISVNDPRIIQAKTLRFHDHFAKLTQKNLANIEVTLKEINNELIQNPK